MRVLHVYKTYYPDSFSGVAEVINQLARNSSRFGIAAEVLSLNRDKDARTIELDGHVAHSVPRDFELASTGFSLAAISKFKQLAKDMDLIHYHYPWPYMDLMRLASGLRIPSLVTYHSDIVKQRFLERLYSPLQLNFLASMDRIVATSPNYFQSSPTLQRYRKKVQVIPIGIDEAKYAQPSEALLARWRRRVGDSFFLFVGALRYYKGLHTLLEAAAGTSFPVVILGEGPMGKELKEYVRNEGLQNVTFLGALPDADKVALLKLCLAFVFPSHVRSEAFGISLLEGAMYGKPLISCEIGSGMSYINVNNETGFIVPPNNAFEFRRAMSVLWERRELAEQMGTKARRRYLDLFTAEDMNASYYALYRSLIDSPPGS